MVIFPQSRYIFRSRNDSSPTLFKCRTSTTTRTTTNTRAELSILGENICILVASSCSLARSLSWSGLAWVLKIRIQGSPFAYIQGLPLPTQPEPVSVFVTVVVGSPGASFKDVADISLASTDLSLSRSAHVLASELLLRALNSSNIISMKLPLKPASFTLFSGLLPFSHSTLCVMVRLSPRTRHIEHVDEHQLLELVCTVVNSDSKQEEEDDVDKSFKDL